MHESSRKAREFAAGGFIQAAEAESRKLARELHDDLNQELVVLAIEISRLEQELPAAQRSKAQLLRRRVEEIIDSIRSFARRLHPSMVEDLGLPDALKTECQALSADSVAVSFSADNVPADIPLDSALCVYRIAQEAVRNAIKHSDAGSVHVRLAAEHGNLILTVQDLGRGFDPGSASAKTGLGLTIISERARLAGGDFLLRSAPGRGTLVRVSIPIFRAVGAVLSSEG